MMHAVMKAWHPMVGVDFHICNNPPPAPPIPWTPYRTAHILFNVSGYPCPTYFKDHPSSGWGYTMSKGTDIGWVIPHVGPPSLTLALEILFSASKSHFGASAYMGVDNKGVKQPICVALLGFTNPNLNCGIPTPTPTGMVLALNTHVVGMTWGDVIAGFSAMGWDATFQVIMNKVGSLIGQGLGRVAGKIGGQFIPASNQAAKLMLSNMGVRKVTTAMAKQFRLDRIAYTQRMVGMLSTPVAEAALGFIVGSPMGVDAGAFGFPTPFQAVTKPASDYIYGPTVDNLEPSAPPPPENLFDSPEPEPDPAPAADTTPVSAPAPAPAPAPEPTPPPAGPVDEGPNVSEPPPEDPAGPVDEGPNVSEPPPEDPAVCEPPPDEPTPPPEPDVPFGPQPAP